MSNSNYLMYKAALSIVDVLTTVLLIDLFIKYALFISLSVMKDHKKLHRNIAELRLHLDNAYYVIIALLNFH